jgi:hypothetical protein
MTTTTSNVGAAATTTKTGIIMIIVKRGRLPLVFTKSGFQISRWICPR